MRRVRGMCRVAVEAERSHCLPPRLAMRCSSFPRNIGDKSSMENNALIQKLTEVAKCSICISTLCDPKALPCVHTFCCACLTKYESEMRKKPGDEMPCPLCRKLFTLPCTGSSGLPNNFFIENILQSLAIAADEEVTIDCDVCLANQEESDEEICVAEMYCTDCRENMCSQCSNEHRRQKLSRGHCIVPIENRTTEELLKHKTVSTCEQHDGRPQEIYCFNCKNISCVMCFVEIHKSHDCCDIKKAAEQFRPQLGLTFEKFRRYEREALAKKDQLKKDRTSLLHSVTDTEKQIRDRSEFVKSLVDEHTLSLLRELALVKQNKVKEYEEAEEQIERHLTIMSSYETYSEVLKSRGSPADICRAVDGLQETAKEIDKSHEFTQNQTISFTAKRLNATRLPNLLQQRNIIGTIEDLPERLQQSDPLMYEPIDKQKFDIQVCFRWNGQRRLLMTNLLSTVEQFMQQISTLLGIELQHLSVNYEGRQFHHENTKKLTLEDCHIQHLTTVDVHYVQ